MPGEDVSYTIFLLVFAAAGFASGFVSGFFGIGGGFVRMPIFIFLFPMVVTQSGFAMHTAAATSLALGIPSGLMALKKRLGQGNFDLAYFRHWAVGLVVGTLIGVAFFRYVPELAMKILFVVFILGFALYFVFAPDELNLRRAPLAGLPRLVLSAGIASYVVMIGVGGGSATSLVQKACNMPLQRALALGTASGLVINALGSIGCMVCGWYTPGLPEWSLGFVDGIVFLAMLPGIVLAAGWGATASQGMDKKLLKKIYGGFLIVVTLFMVYNLAFPSSGTPA